MADPVQRGLEAALDGVALRQKVVAQNLANAMTPGYRSQRVDFEGALGKALQSGRDPRGSVASVGDAGRPARYDGNSVEPETENVELIRASLTYEALVEAASHRVRVMRSALGR